MGGKSSAPPPPDLTATAAADTTASNNQYALGQQQLQWSKDQFAQTWPAAQAYLQQQSASSADETQNAQNQQQFYDSTYKPMEASFANTASTYDNPENAAQKSGAAMADVAATFDAQRNAATSNLESFGIDPSQTRYGALDLGSRISQAAATAAAGTQSNLNTQATGLALQGEAINTGRGYAGNVAQAYNTATNSGQAGINAANNTTATGANTMGTPTQYMGLGNTALGNAGQAGAASANYSLGVQQNNNAASANTSAGIGQLIGAGIGIAGLAMM